MRHADPVTSDRFGAAFVIDCHSPFLFGLNKLT
jgi:hypothetical protein